MSEKKKSGLLRDLGALFSRVNPFRSRPENQKHRPESNYIIGRRRLDRLKKDLIRLRPTKDICHLLVSYLKDFLETNHIGIYLWDETSGSFSTDRTGVFIDSEFRVYDPFFMYAADTDRIIEKKETGYKDAFPKDVEESLKQFFELTKSDLVIPLCMNQSLVALIFVGIQGGRYPGRAKLFNIEEVRSTAVMALSNSLLYARLEGLLHGLEEKVKERTRALEEAQAQLVEREKLATLGVMVAGIAHELNTPAGVIQGSSENLEKSLMSVLDALMNNSKELLKHEALLTGIMERLARRQFKVVSGGYRLRKALKEKLPVNLRNPDRLAVILTEKGITAPDADPFSDDLVQELFRILPSLDESSEDGLLSFIEQMSSLEKNLSNLSHAISSIVRIVKALKTYSRPEQGMTGLFSVEEGIDNTIILLSSLWKHKIEIIRDYNNAGEIECDGDEINQVWTNLITNSCQAMDGVENPELKIETKRKEDSVLVRISDNGPGVPAEIRSRVWDPFFTTKDQGQGSGLGLAIVRNIIERHSGKIRLQSEPGKTEFEIELPLSYTATEPKERKTQLPFKFR